MTLHLGFTGTRRGMSSAQVERVCELLDDDLGLNGFILHHGDCVGADAEFHAICRTPRGGPVTVIVHPSTHPLRAYCNGDAILAAQPPLVRNAAIIAASQVMVAAPYEDEPQPRGGTWRTIGMARRALELGLLRQLYVVGRGGVLLDHGRWL